MSARLASILMVASLSAQTPAKFEIASVKSNRGGDAGGEASEREAITASPGGVTARNASLRALLRWAYRVQDYQISGPGWLGAEKYDIAAKASGAVPPDEVRAMMQALLTERFQLVLHRDRRDLAVYWMVASKKGPKLRPSDVDSPGLMLPDGGSLVFHHYSMSELADRLAMRPFGLDRPVIDKTLLDGRFDFSLQLADNPKALKRTLEGMELGQGESMFTAISEQLGLRFQPQKGPVETLVVDRASRTPTEND